VHEATKPGKAATSSKALPSKAPARTAPFPIVGIGASAGGLEVGTNGGAQGVDVSVEALTAPEALSGMVVIVFRDVAAPPIAATRRNPARSARMRELEAEAQHLREELQSTREELKSANEELQSTNEELTTSKEEMQSLNEELQTVNAELQSKVDDLSRAGSDMKNLLDSTDIAMVFLDNALHLRRFTTPTTRIIKLIPTDVGRPLTDIVTELDYPELEADTQAVLASLVPMDRQVQTRDGEWYRVRLIPYRTTENVIDGVVITFTDLSAIKRLELKLHAEGGLTDAGTDQ
jgi:two-component system CheB/CheR fusion protein